MIKGNAVLAIWHDIDPAAQTEYMEWHTREHMPERLSIPGFAIGKRLINHELDRHRYGTIYAGDELEVFRSQAYLDRLNNPTEWSLRVQPAFRNFLRVACIRLASRGVGDGGALATMRLRFAPGAGERELRGGAGRLADALHRITGVCCAHVGLARAEVSDVRTRETELRPEMSETPFDALVLAEGSGRPELEAVMAEMEGTVTGSGCGLASPETLVYHLAYQLGASDMGKGMIPIPWAARPAPPSIASPARRSRLPRPACTSPGIPARCRCSARAGAACPRRSC